MFETNFFGLAALMKRVLPGMRARGYGHIVNISSIGGLVGNPGTGYYCATKFAVEGLSQSLAKEAGPLGIRVTLIEPGPFRTDFQGRSMTVPEKTIEAYAQTAGARRSNCARAAASRPAIRCALPMRSSPSSNPPLRRCTCARQDRPRARPRQPQRAHSLDRRLGRSHARHRLSKAMIVAARDLRIEPVTGALGAEILGIDIASDLDDATIAAIRQALLEHCVIFFRDQELDIPRQKAFTSRFGTLFLHPTSPARPPIPR
jgi:hypothetical protein